MQKFKKIITMKWIKRPNNSIILLSFSLPLFFIMFQTTNPLRIPPQFNTSFL